MNARRVRSESSSPITTTNGNYGKPPPVLNGDECRRQPAVWWITVKSIGDMNVIWWHHLSSRRQGLPTKTKTKSAGNNNGMMVVLKDATSHKVTFWNIIMVSMCLLFVIIICTLSPCRRKQERSENTNISEFWSICIKLELSQEMITGSKIECIGGWNG